MQEFSNIKDKSRLYEVIEWLSDEARELNEDFVAKVLKAILDVKRGSARDKSIPVYMFEE